MILRQAAAAALLEAIIFSDEGFRSCDWTWLAETVIFTAWNPNKTHLTGSMPISLAVLPNASLYRHFY
jgi:hypothetical protein